MSLSGLLLAGLATVQWRRSSEQTASLARYTVVAERGSLPAGAQRLKQMADGIAAWEQDGILSGKRASHLLIAQPHRLIELAEQVKQLHARYLELAAEP